MEQRWPGLRALVERTVLTAVVDITASDKTPKGKFALNFVHRLTWVLLRPTVHVRSKGFLLFFCRSCIFLATYVDYEHLI